MKVRKPQPIEGRIRLVVSQQALKLRLKFLSLPPRQYERFRKAVCEFSDTVYRIGFDDGAMEQRRLHDREEFAKKPGGKP